MIRLLTHFVAGLLFAIGLVTAGMTQPQKILGFLDVFGQWDPSLAFVMLGAIGVHSLAYRLTMRRKKPLLADRFHVPKRRDIDLSLVAGAALFGIGWGLAGYCPGPALVAFGAGSAEAMLLLAGIFGGYLLFGQFHRWSERRARQTTGGMDGGASLGA